MEAKISSYSFVYKYSLAYYSIFFIFTGMHDTDLTNTLNHLGGAGKNSFINGICKDLKKATECAQKAGLKFETPLTAVYHYRKHGDEFANFIMKSGNKIEVYLGPVKNHIFSESNLRESHTLQVSLKIYIILKVTFDPPVFIVVHE